MKQRREGVIVLIAGIAGQRPVAAYVAGTAANAALMGFGNALGGASLNDGIRVVTVNPGAVQTDRLEAALRVQAEKKLGDGSRWAELLRDLGLPGGRPATPKEVGDLVTFLASARASYVSGTVITIDGGLSSSNRMG
jgi:NAD(P)-dependent dehydrogenase (short-subunit alcohol dehydrogenase family)